MEQCRTAENVRQTVSKFSFAQRNTHTRTGRSQSLWKRIEDTAIGRIVEGPKIYPTQVALSIEMKVMATENVETDKCGKRRDGCDEEPYQPRNDCQAEIYSSCRLHQVF